MSASRDTKTWALLALIVLLGFVVRLLALDYFDVRDRYELPIPQDTLSSTVNMQTSANTKAEPGI